MCTCVIPRAPPCSTRWIWGPGHHHPRRAIGGRSAQAGGIREILPSGNRADSLFSRSAKYGFLPELKQIGDYFTATNQRTILMPQCETAGALEHIEEIAALDGIDGILSGRMIFLWRWALRRGSPPRGSPRLSTG
ncbi:MAG: hypothetical protein ACLRWP_06275 [Bilophila wadsworthia]